jgi:hypothetical protein
VLPGPDDFTALQAAVVLLLIWHSVLTIDWTAHPLGSARTVPAPEALYTTLTKRGLLLGRPILTSQATMISVLRPTVPYLQEEFEPDDARSVLPALRERPVRTLLSRRAVDTCARIEGALNGY